MIRKVPGLQLKYDNHMDDILNVVICKEMIPNLSHISTFNNMDTCAIFQKVFGTEPTVLNPRKLSDSKQVYNCTNCT